MFAAQEKQLSRSGSKAFTDAHRSRVEEATSNFASLFASLEDAEGTIVFLQMMCSGQLMLAVTMIDGRLFVRAIPVEEVEKDPSRITVLSYRWQASAVAFSQAYSWSDAIKSLSTAGIHEIPAQNEFHDSLLALMSRTGVENLWVDQLCVPQNQAETMDIVHASGDFYKKFKVLVWTPWATMTDAHIVEMFERLEDDADGLGLHIAAAQQVCDLYLQFKRGWILRETCRTAQLAKQECGRNVDIINDLKRRFDTKIKTGILPGDERELVVRAAGECVHLEMVLESMKGEPLKLEDHVLMAARVTLAPFTVLTDRAVVAELDKYVLTTNVAKTASVAEAPLNNFLRVLMFIGTGRFQTGAFSDWKPYRFDEKGCRDILFWLATTTTEFVSYSQTLWEIFEKRFRGEKEDHFTAFLPENYPLKDFSMFSPFGSISKSEGSEGQVGIRVTSYGVVPYALKSGYHLRGVKTVPAAEVMEGSATSLLTSAFSGEVKLFVSF